MAYIQGTSISDSFNTTLSVTLSSNVTTGSGVLVVWVTSSSQPTSVTSSIGTVTDQTTGTGGNGFLVGSGWVKNAASGSYTLTINVASSQSLRLWAFEYGSLTTFDVASAIANGFSTSAASAGQTPAAGGETAIGIIHIADPGITLSAWGSSLTQDAQIFANNHSITVASLASAGAGSISASATLSPSGGWGAWIQFISGGSAVSVTPKVYTYRRRRV